MNYAKRNRKKYANWQSLVEHGRIHSDIVSVPDSHPKTITHEQIRKIELKAKEGQPLARIRLRYQNPSHYRRVFMALVVAEDLYEKGVKVLRERKNTKARS